MDQELQDLLRAFDSIAEEVEDPQEIEIQFTKDHPGWKLAIFANPTCLDDNVLLHFWTENDFQGQWVHIHTNDDPKYTELTRGGFLWAHDLWK